MFKKDKSVYDKFTLSLGGVTTISSFAAAQAIAHDRLRQDEVDSDQERSPKAAMPSFGRYWLPRVGRSRAA